MNNLCPNAALCPVFDGRLKDKLVTIKSYKSLFCEAGETKWMSCKRYIVKNKFGKCPPDLLPNNSMTLEQIIKKYELV